MMTIGKAIEILTPETTKNALFGIEKEEAIQLVNEACNVAVAALKGLQKVYGCVVYEATDASCLGCEIETCDYCDGYEDGYNECLRFIKNVCQNSVNI